MELHNIVYIYILYFSVILWGNPDLILMFELKMAALKKKHLSNCLTTVKFMKPYRDILLNPDLHVLAVW